MRKILATAVCTLIFCGCDLPPEAPATKAVTSLKEIDGNWKVVEATDPSGASFEAHNLEMVISAEKSSATSDGQTLRLEFNSDGTSLRLYHDLELVSEVSVDKTTEAIPPQMLWTDKKNSKQVTLFEKK